MRVSFLTPYYPPEMGAPPARIHEIAIRLRAFGHDVTVVAAFPNRPLGRIYDGYGGRLMDCSMEDGVRVIRTWIRPSAASATFIWRMINDLSFTWSSGWLTARRMGPQDVLVVQNPPVFLAFSATRLARKTGAKVVTWCGDVWPDVLLQSGQMKPGLLANTIRRAQKYAFSHSSLLAVTNPTIAADTSRGYRCPPVVIWSNGVDTQMFAPTKRSEALRAELGVRPDEILVGYVGLHGRFQGLDAVVDAARILRDRPFRFVFVGEGVEKARLVQAARNAGLRGVSFLDPLPKAAMPSFVASCDVAVVSLLKRMSGTMPSKFYEALAAGTIPLVADGCEAAPLVQQHEAGVLYEPGDGRSAADALERLRRIPLDDREGMRRRCRELAMRFDRDRLAAHVNATLVALAAGAPIPPIEW